MSTWFPVHTKAVKQLFWSISEMMSSIGGRGRSATGWWHWWPWFLFWWGSKIHWLAYSRSHSHFAPVGECAWTTMLEVWCSIHRWRQAGWCKLCFSCGVIARFISLFWTWNQQIFILPSFASLNAFWHQLGLVLTHSDANLWETRCLT